MQSDNAENKDEGQDEDDDGVDLEAGGLVRVEAQHGGGAAAGAGGPRARGAGVGDLLLLVGGGASSDGRPGASGGSGRHGAADLGARGRRVDGR